jgi:hypothetical protein
MESIFARCPVCQKTQQVRGALTGKKAKCQCGEVFVVSGESLSQVKAALWKALAERMQDGDTQRVSAVASRFARKLGFSGADRLIIPKSSLDMLFP